MQLHAFCDASRSAYATAVFARTVQEDGNIEVQLLQSKARVAPLKKPTIPRLELLGAVIQSRLVKSIMDVLEIEVPIYYWTDSSTALSWIQRNDEWGTFVGRRVKEICQLTDSNNLHHIPGVNNPADFPSRGCSPRELLSSRWWEGPEWLKKPQSQWPSGELIVDEDAVNAEKKKTPTTSSCNKNITTIVEKPWYFCFSSYNSTVRLIGWIRRFIHKCQKKNSESEELQIPEINAAELMLYRLIQKEVFPKKEDYIGGVQIHRKDDGLIRTRTKITNRPDLENFCWPVLLPHSHPVVDQMIREVHQQHGHAGSQFVLVKLREKVWILKSRKAVRRIIQACIICRRFRAKAPTVPSAPLPLNRVKDAKAFEITGVDLAGPLHLKNQSKVWVVLFTCAVIRAIHLELVKSLGTDSFLLAFDRFISRRGRPSIIYSDNGTNFRGADNLFRRINWLEVEKSSKTTRIQWIFNPPAAPWWGGFWERLIQTVKDLLRKMLGHSKVDFVQLETILCHIESIVNGRPLTYVTEDDEDLIPLTPAAFLQDIHQVEHPEIHTLNEEEFRNKYSNLLQLRSELRSRFRSEYLGKLIQNSKITNSKDFKIGEVVLLAKENTKRMDWPLARILELLPGSDGHKRVARVQTQFGEFLRPVQRLIPLEIHSSLDIPTTPIVLEEAKKHMVASKPDKDLSVLEPQVDLAPESIIPEVLDEPNRVEEPVKKRGRPKGTKKIVIAETIPTITRSGRTVKKPQRL